MSYRDDIQMNIKQREKIYHELEKVYEDKQWRPSAFISAMKMLTAAMEETTPEDRIPAEWIYGRKEAGK